MLERWLLLWKRVGAIGDGNAAFTALSLRYAERHRAYHTLSHIEECLRLFDELKALASQPDVMEWAIWFHDVVYDPKAKDNEERSAEIGRELALNAGLSPEFAHRAVELVMATKHHNPVDDPDAELLVDIDLAI